LAASFPGTNGGSIGPVYKLKIIDANAEKMGWPEFTKLLDKYHPKYYMTQLTAPTLENDMYGCFLAKARGAKTIAFGTHITPIPRKRCAHSHPWISAWLENRI